MYFKHDLSIKVTIFTFTMCEKSKDKSKAWPKFSLLSQRPCQRGPLADTINCPSYTPNLLVMTTQCPFRKTWQFTIIQIHLRKYISYRPQPHWVSAHDVQCFSRPIPLPPIIGMQRLGSIVAVVTVVCIVVVLEIILFLTGNNV